MVGTRGTERLLSCLVGIMRETKRKGLEYHPHFGILQTIASWLATPIPSPFLNFLLLPYDAMLGTKSLPYCSLEGTYDPKQQQAV